jgi:nucleoside-diphosphate-sugar epimerase
MKVLVTGGGGFVGLAVVKMLRARGDEVRVLARGNYPEVTKVGAEMMRGDIARRDIVFRAAEDMDAVVHVAAKAGVWGKAEEYEAANVTGTQSVLDACKEHGVRALVYTSSPSVTFDGGDALHANESLPYPEKHLYHYGRTKAEAERRVMQANGTQTSNGTLMTTALRPHLVYGPGDPHILPRMVQRSRQGRLRIIGTGKNLVDVTYVDNAAHAHVLALNKLMSQEPRPAGKVYFISQGKPVVPWEWLNHLFRELGVPTIRKRLPLGAAYAIGSVCEALWSVFPLDGEPPLTRFVAAQLGTSHCYDLAAAWRDLDYKPIVDDEESLRRTVDWFKVHPPAQV